MNAALPDSRIEPELRTPIPRRIARRDAPEPGSRPFRRLSREAICLVYLLVPFFLTDLGLLATLFQTTSVQRDGRLAMGTVLPPENPSGNAGDSDDRDSSPHGMVVHYAFTVDGRTYTASDRVNVTDANFYRDGATVIVRYSPLAPGWCSMLPEGNAGELGGGGIAALLLCAVFAIFPLGTLIAGAYDSRYVRSGTPVVGTIAEHWRESPNDPELPKDAFRYKIRYSYASADNGAQLGRKYEREMTMSREQWEELNRGDTVTVLYLPNEPDSSLIYYLGPYRSLES